MIIGGLSYPSTNHGILGTSGMQNVRNDKMINSSFGQLTDFTLTCSIYCLCRANMKRETIHLSESHPFIISEKVLKALYQAQSPVL